MGRSISRIRSSLLPEHEADLVTSSTLSPMITGEGRTAKSHLTRIPVPVLLCDEVVEDFAAHYYTLPEIADRFDVALGTLQTYHVEAFRRGRDKAMKKPRMMLARIISDFDEEGLNLARRGVPTHNLLAAIELHAKMYCGLGAKSEITIKQEDPLAHLSDEELKLRLEQHLKNNPL